LNNIVEEEKGNYQNFGGMDDENEDLGEKTYPQEDEDPYQNDEQTYQEHFRKTFITENQKKMVETTTK
jgi:hypothetical protein